MSRGRWAAGAAVLGLGLLLAPSGAADRKGLSIKEIMTKAHKGGNSLLTGVGKDLEADEPRWDDAREKTRELVRLGTTLGRLTPPLGGKESWATLTNRYVVSAKVLDASVQKKDGEAARAALQQLRKQCAGCHKAHRKEAD